MAPMTRSNALVSQEASRAGSDTRSDRELSEEPSSCYGDERDSLRENRERYIDDMNYDMKKMPLKGPEDEDDILHPLREAANRVGREVEKFAEVLDGYNPHSAINHDDRQDMMFDLIGHFRRIALDTVERLREKHESERRKNDGRRWKRKMRGLKVTQSNDDLAIESSDDQECSSFELQTTLEDLERWEQEAQTWDLLHRLAPIRFGPKPLEHKPIHQFSSEQDLWHEFLRTDDLAIERRTVLQWLKETAEDSGEDIDILVEDLQKNAERGDIIAHGWLHTKAAIKDHKRRTTLSHALSPKAPEVEGVLLNPSKTEPLATQLDPDAMTRQKRKLAYQDEYFERAIWLGCYEMLRRGRSSKIREWCIERTEIWRAISMSGFPDERPEDSNTIIKLESTALWRRMCFAVARNTVGDDHEKAVYGILSGDISSVEPVCRTWDDFLFVHFNALLRTQFDQYIGKYLHPSNLASLTSFGVFDAVQFHGEPHSAAMRLIETLKADPRTKEESMKPMKMLQGVLIADQFANFIYQQGLALSKFANAKDISRVIPPNKNKPENEEMTRYIPLDDHDSLRVLTHVLIIFMGLGLDLGDVYRETEVENIIVAYVSFLRLAGKEELIPLYCSQLSGRRKYAILCRNLIDVIDDEQRVIQLQLMRDLGLDVQEFVSLQARYLLDDFPDVTVGYPALGKFKLFSASQDSVSSHRALIKDFIGDEDSVERIDLLLIRSLQWYLLVDGLWTETFKFGTMLYLRFFKNMQLCAAKMLSVNVSSKTIMERKTRAILDEPINLFNTEFSEEQAMADAADGMISHQQYLQKHMLAQATTFRELEILIECLDSIDTAACLDEMKKQGLSNQEPRFPLSEWRNGYQAACEEARICARSLMKGWLLSSSNEELQAELKLIRNVYLPETLLGYVTTIHRAGLHLTRDFLLEAMDVSSILGEEGSDVLDLFIETGRLQEMVDNLARASKTLLISSGKQTSGSRGKKMRKKGWTPDLWSVKP